MICSLFVGKHDAEDLDEEFDFLGELGEMDEGKSKKTRKNDDGNDDDDWDDEAAGSDADDDDDEDGMDNDDDEFGGSDDEGMYIHLNRLILIMNQLKITFVLFKFVNRIHFVGWRRCEYIRGFG